jgi:hypothetical protein
MALLTGMDLYSEGCSYVLVVDPVPRMGAASGVSGSFLNCLNLSFLRSFFFRLSD